MTLKKFTGFFGALFGLALFASVPFPAAAIEPFEHALPSKLATKALLLDVADTGKRLIAVGEFGHIVYSDDNGQNWKQAESVPTRATLTGVFFADDKTGFAVGHDTTILKTIDGGENWHLKFTERRGENPLFGIYFANDKNGLAVGAFSTVLSTSDGGESWTPRSLIASSDSDFHLNDIFADAKGHIYIPAEFGTIYKSTSGGRTFTALKSGYDGSFWGGMALKAGRLLVWGMRGSAYISSNGGKKWKKAKTNSDRSISGGTQLADGRIVLTGLSGSVLISKNRGKTFTAIVRPDRLSFSNVSRGGEGEVLLYGDLGILAHKLK